MNTTEENIEEEKKEIEEKQELHAEEIIEVDEAAGAAEGLKNRNEELDAIVEEEREPLPNTAIDVPETDIIQ